MPGPFVPIELPMLPQSKAVRLVTGMKVHLGAMKDIGERGFNLERLFNIRMGLTSADDSLSKRLTDEPQRAGEPRSRVPLEKMKRQYYKVRGWDASGVPSERKIRRLKLAG